MIRQLEWNDWTLLTLCSERMGTMSVPRQRRSPAKTAYRKAKSIRFRVRSLAMLLLIEVFSGSEADQLPFDWYEPLGHFRLRDILPTIAFACNLEPSRTRPAFFQNAISTRSPQIWSPGICSSCLHPNSG
jgi:hypothetical protein